MTAIPTELKARRAYFSALGKMGGAVKSEAKRIAVIRNARKRHPYVPPPPEQPKPKVLEVDTSCTKCGAQPPYDLKINGEPGKHWFWKEHYRCGKCGHMNKVWGRPGTDGKRHSPAGKSGQRG